MSRNKNGNFRGKNRQPAQSPPVPPQNASPPEPVATETDRRQNRRITWSLIVTGASFTLSVVSAYFTYSSSKSSDKSAKEASEANKLAQAAQDRAAGKVQARFEFVEDKNQDPNRFKEFMRKKDGYDQQIFRIESVDEILRWGPHVRIKNTGTEPIDAIKTDVHYLIGYAYGVGVQQINPVPMVVNEISSHEATTVGKLMPGQTAKLGLTPLLLNQISRLNWQDFADKDHFGIFTVTVYGRLVGSSSYDRMEKDKPVVFEFHWRPAGFKNDAKHVKELLEIKPSVVIE